MSNFERLQVSIAEHYFKLLRPYEKMDKARLFIQRWIEVVKSYSDLPYFVSFDPPIPILTRLVPKAKYVILVPFCNSRVSRLPREISVFPYYPFRVKQEHTDTLCKIGLEFFHMYLEITGIRLICIYKLWFQEKKVVDELRDRHPDLKIYTTGSYNSFREIILKSRKHGSKLQCRLSNP